MEKEYDRTIETKALIKRKFISFPSVYWLAFIIIVIVISYSDGEKRLANYDFTGGVVVDKVFLRARRSWQDKEYAQWQYVANNDTLLFVDKQYFTYNKPLGTKRKIIYLTSKPDEARVYSFQFWINLPLLLITTFIAIFIFAICQFAIHWNDKNWFIKRNRTY